MSRLNVVNRPQHTTPAAGRGGDRDAFVAEALPHLPSLFRVAMWLVRNRAEAEDLVQETFIKALASCHGYQPGTNCRAWLVTIMYHLESKRRRKNARLRLVADDGHSAAAVACAPAPPQELTDAEVIGALARLPGGYSQVVLLADVEDLSYKEIAAALRVPLGTVMSRLSRGRRALRVELAAYAGARGIGRERAATAAAAAVVPHQSRVA